MITKEMKRESNGIVRSKRVFCVASRGRVRISVRGWGEALGKHSILQALGGDGWRAVKKRLRLSFLFSKRCYLYVSCNSQPLLGFDRRHGLRKPAFPILILLRGIDRQQYRLDSHAHAVALGHILQFPNSPIRITECARLLEDHVKLGLRVDVGHGDLLVKDLEEVKLLEDGAFDGGGEDKKLVVLGGLFVEHGFHGLEDGI